MQATQTSGVAVKRPGNDPQYLELRRQLQQRVNDVPVGTPLFRVAPGEHYYRFLQRLPVEVRQEYNCRTCSDFFRHYGDVVWVNSLGQTQSVLWPVNLQLVPALFRDAVRECRDAIDGLPIVRPFLPNTRQWGVARTGDWTHFAVTVRADLCRTARPTQTHFQTEAELMEEFSMLTRALHSWRLKSVKKAGQMLKSGVLPRASAHARQAEWLERVWGVRSKPNLLWLEVVKAPSGWCHVGNGALGLLVQSIEDGASEAELIRQHGAVMRPTQYMRPSAAPAAGQLQKAEKLVEQLGSAGALERRQATLEDVQEWVWRKRPTPAPQPTLQVFAGVAGKPGRQPKQPTVTVGTPVTMTWAKFARTVLPQAVSVRVSQATAHSGYGMLAALNPASPPILQWDREDRRNTVSWFTNQPGVPITGYGARLEPNNTVELEGVCRFPQHWNGGDADKWGDGVLLVVNGSGPYPGGGNALFPEFLRSEYHGVRASIEALSKSATMHRVDRPIAALAIRSQTAPSPYLQLEVVTRDNVQAIYRIDRWD